MNGFNYGPVPDLLDPARNRRQVAYTPGGVGTQPYMNLNYGPLGSSLVPPAANPAPNVSGLTGAPFQGPGAVALPATPGAALGSGPIPSYGPTAPTVQPAPGTVATPAVAPPGTPAASGTPTPTPTAPPTIDNAYLASLAQTNPAAYAQYQSGQQAMALMREQAPSQTLPWVQTGLYGLNAATQGILGFMALDAGKQQFEEQQKLAWNNYWNSVQSYNTNVTDRVNGRYSGTDRTPEQIQAEKDAALIPDKNRK